MGFGARFCLNIMKIDGIDIREVLYEFVQEVLAQIKLDGDRFIRLVLAFADSGVLVY